MALCCSCFFSPGHHYSLLLPSLSLFPRLLFLYVFATDAAAGRAARRAAKREVLIAAATNLALLRRSIVLGLARLVEFKAIPDPGYTFLLSRLVTLLDGHAAEVGSCVCWTSASFQSAQLGHFVGVSAVHHVWLTSCRLMGKRQQGTLVDALTACSWSLFHQHLQRQGSLCDSCRQGWAEMAPACCRAWQKCKALLPAVATHACHCMCSHRT